MGTNDSIHPGPGKGQTTSAVIVRSLFGKNP